MGQNDKSCGTCYHGAECAPGSIACHRYPPTITKIDDEKDMISTHFPVVNSKSWCGEWAAKRRQVNRPA